MWAFIDIGFTGGMVATILMVAWVVRYFREKKRNERRDSIDDPEWKERLARHCDEENRKYNEWYARHKEEYREKGIELP